MIPTNYTILEYSKDPFEYEIFFANKNISSCYTGLKYPIKFGITQDKKSPLLQVSNLRTWVPWGMTPCEDSFLVSISNNPTILSPETCKLDKRDIQRIFQWITKNLDNLNLLFWMHLNNLYSFQTNDIIYTQDSILKSMKPVKRKVGAK